MRYYVFTMLQHGHMEINCRMRTDRETIGQQRSIRMHLFHCHKVGNMERFYQAKNTNKKLGNQVKKINKTWVKRNDKKKEEGSTSTTDVENTPLN